MCKQSEIRKDQHRRQETARTEEGVKRPKIKHRTKAGTIIIAKEEKTKPTKAPKTQHFLV